MAEFPQSARPILFVDVDGVLNPYAGPCPTGYGEHDMFPGEQAIRLNPGHAEWLTELRRHVDLVWATAWTPANRERLTALLGLPAFDGTIELPDTPFDAARKVPAVAAVAGDRPAAWIDDQLGPASHAWAGRRAAPTLLVPIDPSIGLSRDDVDRIGRWAARLARR